MIALSYDVDHTILRLQARVEDRLQARLLDATGEILKFIEAQQIKKYTRTDHPPRLRYERTFQLRHSSQTQITRSRLPVIEAAWLTNLDHAKYVVGRRNEQAKIHRGRWLSADVVEDRAQKEADTITRKHMGSLAE